MNNHTFVVKADTYWTNIFELNFFKSLKKNRKIRTPLSSNQKKPSPLQSQQICHGCSHILLHIEKGYGAKCSLNLE